MDDITGVLGENPACRVCDEVIMMEHHNRILRPNIGSTITPQQIVLAGDVPLAVSKIFSGYGGAIDRKNLPVNSLHKIFRPDSICLSIRAALTACLNLSLDDCIQMASRRSDYSDQLLLAALTDTLTCHSSKHPNREELKALVLQTLTKTIASMGTTTVCDIDRLLTRLSSAAKVPPKNTLYTLLMNGGETSHNYMQTLMLLYTVGITTGAIMIFDGVSKFGGLEFVSDGLQETIRYRLDAPHAGTDHDHGPGESHIHLHMTGKDNEELCLYYNLINLKVECYIPQE